MSIWAKTLRLAVASACALAVLPAVAGAEISYEKNIGEAGAGAGKLSNPAGLAVNTASGELYVADRGNNRISQFTSAGAFIRAWGYDVVASGEDDKPFADEVSEVRIRAASGSFALTFKGESTAQLPYDATPGEVQAALNGLTSISTGGGSVAVSGGPGDPTGANPYVVTFSGGPLAKTNLELGIEPSGLGIPSGTQLSCEGGPSTGANPAESFAYQWLANGAPIAAATASTFTPGAGEAGKAIQCRVAASFGSVKTLATSRPYQLATPAPAILPPFGPVSLAAPTGSAILESAGGVPLTCNAGAWSRNPATFTYQWYRNGVPVGVPTTTAATSDEYVLTQADLATRAVFQCAVTGNNPGGSSTAISQFLPTNPKPIQPEAKDTVANVEVAASGASRVLARTNGGAVLEVCKANPPSTDVCKVGVAGGGVGQLDAPRSIAVDNSALGAGAVYVMDDGNPRVQKFSAVGNPLVVIGGGVNQTTDGNVCTPASGDACGRGVVDKQGLAGAFGGAATSSDFDELGNELSVDPLGSLYVGDSRADLIQSRIQKFDSAGSFLSQARVPYVFANPSAPTKPVAIVADSTQRIYASTRKDFAAIEKFSPGEFTLDGTSSRRPGNLFHQDGDPVQLAVDPRNDRLIVSDPNQSEVLSICGGQGVSRMAIVEYDSMLHRIDCTAPTGLGSLPDVNGMAVSKAGLLFAAVGSANTIKVFKLPTSVAPQIVSPSVSEITTVAAEVHAQINPGFEDTTYKVEYGLANCATNPCESATGGTLYGLKFVDGATKISGLQPNTTYRYRVIAENKLGKATSPNRTFTTFPLVDLVNDPCPNALARKQTKTVGLLDCRAYELASAAFTGGYDVESNLVSGQSPFDTHPAAADKLLYGVHEGGIPGTGNPTNRGLDPYVASRNSDGTWSTQYRGIPADNPFATAPFSSTLAGSDTDLDTLAFGGPEICAPCFADGSAGIPVRRPNGSLVQGMAGSIPQLAAKPAGHVAKALAADGSHLIFGSTSQFEPAGNSDGKLTIYSRDLGAGSTEVVSTLPGGETMDGAKGEAGELDVSADGSRVLLGEAISTDAKGNVLWHPYLHLAANPNSVDLAPLTISGVLFAGMSADGSQVFFTSADKLLATDTDTSADLYEAAVDSGGSSTLRLVSVKSTGAPSNSDACTPAGEPNSWNSPAGDGKCGALALAGGGGLASEEGSIYFLTPEKLDSTKGTLNQANLYLAKPGADPRFVATIDTSAGKLPASPPTHPLVNSNFGGGGFEAVQALSVDQSNGDVYALDGGTGKVHRFKENGEPHDFAAGPHEANKLTGFSFANPSAAQVAIDNSPSALAGDFYVASEAGVEVFAPSGEALGALNGAATDKGSFGLPCGVAVDQSSGVLYVADAAGYLWRYAPSSPTVPLSDADYTVKGIAITSMQPCALAADKAGHVYASQYPNGPAKQFNAASFASGAPPNQAGTEIAASARALATDPATNDLYVDEGAKVSVFDSTGKAIATIGQGKLACGELGSRGVAVNKTTHHVYASCFAPSAIKEFGYEDPGYHPVDNPAILHATNQAETHSFADFQVTADGRYAAFATTQPLKAGYDNASHSELYRYDAGGAEGAGQLDCVSCSPTESQAQADSGLPPNGLGLLADGRVFFNSGEQLTLKDTNGKLDAYEWSPQRGGTGGCGLPAGCQQLISTGNSAFPSGMLGASSDGADAFFFTRDLLVGEDRNGQAMKIYDARSGGGFFVIPPSPPCAASDECHGPGSATAPPPPIGTFKGTGGQAPASCQKPKVKRRGKCVARHSKPRKHKHGKRHRQGAKAKRGAAR